MLFITKPTSARKNETPAVPPLNEGEMSLVKFKYYKTADAFTQALWTTIFLADALQLTKLAMIYPDHVGAYLNYSRVPGWFDAIIAHMPRRRSTDV